MFQLIYAVPTAGKSFTIKKLLQCKQADDVFLLDTDDLMMYLMNALGHFGWRKLDNDAFWDRYLEDKTYQIRCKNLLKDFLHSLSSDPGRYYIFTNLIELEKEGFSFRLKFARKPDVLSAEYQERRIEAGHGSSVLPGWISTYKYPNNSIILERGQYILDFIDVLRSAFPKLNFSK